jgi:hypothetical protein
LLLSDRRCTFKKIGWWDAKRLTELLQAACADAVYPLLVFLNLLERNPGRIGELGLAQPQQISAGAYLLSDVSIYDSRASAVDRRFRHVKNPVLSFQQCPRVAQAVCRVKIAHYAGPADY